MDFARTKEFLKGMIEEQYLTSAYKTSSLPRAEQSSNSLESSSIDGLDKLTYGFLGFGAGFLVDAAAIVGTFMYICGDRSLYSQISTAVVGTKALTNTVSAICERDTSKKTLDNKF